MNEAIFLAYLQHGSDHDALAAATVLFAWIPVHLGPIEWESQKSRNVAKARGKVKVISGGREFTLFSLRHEGYVSISFEDLSRQCEPQVLEELKMKLRRLEGWNYTMDEMKRWIDKYGMNYLADEETMAEFKSIWQWFLAATRKSETTS